MADLAQAGYSTTLIAKAVGKSNPTVLKTLRFFDDSSVLDELHKNNIHAKGSAWRRLKGKKSSRRGKTYEQIYGTKEAARLKELRSSWLKQNNIRKFATKISKPQAILYSIVKSRFSQAEIEFEVKLSAKKSIWLDIAIPDMKINIEYDGIYWHTLNKNTISLSDNKRDEILFSQGWKVYRIQSCRNLTEEELKIEVDKLVLFHE